MRTHSPSCETLREQIDSYFAYLARDYGFKPVRTDPSTRGDRCMVVLEGSFRIKFILDRESIEVLVGSQHAPISWADISLGQRRWFQAWGAIGMARGAPKPTTTDIMEFGNKVLQMRREDYLKYLAASLRGALDELVGWFGPGDADIERKLEEYYYQASSP